MVRQDVESHGKGEDVAGHEEDEEEQLADTEQFATKTAHHDLAGVGHTEHMRVFLFKLADHIAGICCDDTDAHEDNQRSVTELAFASFYVCVIGTKDASYGTSPSVATALGRESTPSEMVSATMTGIVSDAHFAIGVWNPYVVHIACSAGSAHSCRERSAMQ